MQAVGSCAVNHTHTVPVGRTFYKNCFRKHLWGGETEYPNFFFCYPIIWISQMHVYLSSIVQKREGAKKKKKRKRRNRIIAQIKIAFNTFIHVFLHF